jgi:predicted transcriptional regulator
MIRFVPESEVYNRPRSELTVHYRFFNWPGDEKAAPLGPLERRVLEAMWDRIGPTTVRDLLVSFPNLAYTTLMTTLERLHRKGLLDRTKFGRAFSYTPRVRRDEMIRPLVSFLIETIDAKDTELLDELEELVRSRRSAGPKAGA